MKVKNCLILLCCVVGVFVSGALAQVYQYTDENGNVVFTDQPVAGTKQVKLGVANSFSANTPAPKVTVKAAAKTQKVNYQLTILTPKHEQTFRDNMGKITVSSKLSPITAGEYRLSINGQESAVSGTGVFQLENLDRGAHQLQISFFDNSGKVLALSKSITVYLHRTTRLNRAN